MSRPAPPCTRSAPPPAATLSLSTPDWMRSLAAVPVRESFLFVWVSPPMVLVVASSTAAFSSETPRSPLANSGSVTCAPSGAVIVSGEFRVITYTEPAPSTRRHVLAAPRSAIASPRSETALPPASAKISSPRPSESTTSSI